MTRPDPVQAFVGRVALEQARQLDERLRAALARGDCSLLEPRLGGGWVEYHLHGPLGPNFPSELPVESVRAHVGRPAGAHERRAVAAGLGIPAAELGDALDARAYSTAPFLRRLGARVAFDTRPPEETGPWRTLPTPWLGWPRLLVEHMSNQELADVRDAIARELQRRIAVAFRSWPDPTPQAAVDELLKRRTAPSYCPHCDTWTVACSHKPEPQL